MKATVKIFIGILFLCSASTAAMAQIIKNIQSKKKTPTEKKAPSKKIIKKEVADTASVSDNTFTNLIIQANQGAYIKLTINGADMGKIKPGGRMKFSLENGEELSVLLDDQQGTAIQRNIIVTDENKHRDITIQFPDIDYTAIEKRRRDSINAAIRALYDSYLTQMEETLAQKVKQAVSAKQQIETLVAEVKAGDRNLHNDVTDGYSNFIRVKNEYLLQKKNYRDSAVALDFKERSESFLQQIKPNEEELQDNYGEYIRNVQAGKIPMSNSLEVAVKRSRATDIKFYVNESDINDKLYDGERILVYAIKNGSDSFFISHLLRMGAYPDNFARKLSDNSEIFATPLILACVAGNEDAIRALSSAGARFYPLSSLNKERRIQLKFVNDLLASKPEIIESLTSKGYDLNDGTAQINAVIDEINNNMVLVDGGEFLMGCPVYGSYDCGTDEKPQDTVAVTSFSIGKYEITKKQWQTLMEEDATSGSLKNCDSCPVANISYDEILLFIKKLNEFSRKQFRLPAESEWEYAARGGKYFIDGYKYSGANDIDEVAWYSANSNSAVHPVGGKKPNQLGLYDMNGNILEWCSDWYNENYYSQRKDKTSAGPAEGLKRVVRGGCFSTSAGGCRITERDGYEPNAIYDRIGFRLAMDAN